MFNRQNPTFAVLNGLSKWVQPREVSAVPGKNVGFHHKQNHLQNKRSCWVTHRGRSVTRWGGLSRGEGLRHLRKGQPWGWIRSQW